MALESLYKLAHLLFITPADVGSTFLRAVLLGLFPGGKPHPGLTFKQAVANRMFKAVLGNASALRVRTPLSLEPKEEEERFSVILPASAELYKGPLDDSDIKPQVTGGTWSPRPVYRPKDQSEDDLLVLLHFHGGAYVIGDGRDRNTGFLAKTILKETHCTHVFTPQYRLASNPGGRFPAALQDALSAYLYLIRDLGIPPSSVVFGGDSAGANLALALLQYIAEFGNQLQIPWPAAATLWSPWTDLKRSHEPDHIPTVKYFKADYIPQNFITWGTSTFSGNGKILLSHPYVTPTCNQSFRSETPIWVFTGGKEALVEDNERLVKHLKNCNVEVEWVIDEQSPHDIILIGDGLGFQKEAEESARKAGEFIDKHR